MENLIYLLKKKSSSHLWALDLHNQTGMDRLLATLMPLIQFEKGYENYKIYRYIDIIIALYVVYILVYILIAFRWINLHYSCLYQYNCSLNIFKTFDVFSSILLINKIQFWSFQYILEKNIIATIKIQNNNYGTSNHSLFSIAPCKVITFNPLCILFGISSLLLFWWLPF